MDRWDWQLELHLASFYKLDKTATKLNFSADEVEGLNSKYDVLHKIDRVWILMSALASAPAGKAPTF